MNGSGLSNKNMKDIERSKWKSSNGDTLADLEERLHEACKRRVKAALELQRHKEALRTLEAAMERAENEVGNLRCRINCWVLNRCEYEQKNQAGD